MSLTPSSRILYFITFYNFLHSSYQHLKLYVFTRESNTSVSFVYDCPFLWFRRVSGTQSVLSSEYLSLVAQSCLTLCDPMDCSTPSFSAHHQLLELSHTHVHQVGDAIQPSHLLSSPSPLAFNLSQHPGLFSSSHQMAKVLEFWLQHQSFQWILRNDFVHDGLVGFPCSPRDSQESFPTPQFKSIKL